MCSFTEQWAYCYITWYEHSMPWWSSSTFKMIQMKIQWQEEKQQLYLWITFIIVSYIDQERRQFWSMIYILLSWSCQAVNHNKTIWI